MTRRNCCVAVLLVSFAIGAFGQESRVEWSAKGPDKVIKPAEKFTLTLTAKITDGWHMYSFTQPPGGPTTSEVKIAAGQPFNAAGPVEGPAPHKAFDSNFEMQTETYEGSVDFHLPVLVGHKATAATKQIAVDLKFQVCNDTTCLPPKTVRLAAPVKIIAALTAPAVVKETAVSAAADTSQPQLESKTLPQTAVEVTPTKAQAPVKASDSGTSGIKIQSLGSFIWLAVVMGALSLLTPCVFPMIPITVSYFTNHSSASRRSAIFLALVYGIGIILTFTALGMFLAVVFGAGGVNQLAANPWVNLLITAIFLGFAFSLFGAYFIQVPSVLMNKLDAITRSKEGSGAIGALLMGFTFTLTSFTCTAPFVGTLLVMTAQGNWHWPMVGMLAFSTVFAIPFFLLALAPQLMALLPKASGWMVSIKVVMGFLEIAAAMKFLSNADLVWHWGIFTRQVVLAVWVGIGLLTVLYVLGYFRMAHDSPVESVGAARITVAIVFLATTIWLIPGLFGRQLGELESFLPPEIGNFSPSATQPASTANQHADAGWIMNDYEGAIARAKQENKLVFVDFTGYTCTNCRWMEANMFPRPEIASEMGKFVRLRMYTDGEGEIYQRQQTMQQQKFGTVALPLYALVRPDGTPVATFPGLTRNTSEFLTFLQQGKTQ